MILEPVYTLIGASTAITDVIGSSLHYAERPQTYPLPAVVVQFISGEGDHYLKNASGLIRGSVRVTALASTYLGAHDLADLLVNRLDGYHGTSAGLKIDYLKLDTRSDIPSDHRDGKDLISTHGVQLDFRYHAQKTEPTHT